MVASASDDDVTAGRVRLDRLLAAARDTMANTPFCWAATPSQDGGIDIRVVGPIPGAPGDEDWTVWFTTLGSSRKAADIRRAGRITFGFQSPRDPSYVALMGRAALVEDRAEIRRRWLENWRIYYPGGPEDPDVIFVRVIVDRIEFCVRGVTAEPFGLRHSAVERGAEREWRIVSD